MANNDQIVQRWADVATGKTTARNYSDRARNVFADGDSLYSYGHHFEIARFMRERGKVTWVLMNGDIWRAGGWYRGSTAYHQQLARDVVKATGLPALTVPFSALNSAGIKYGTIKIIESLPESWETSRHWLGSAVFTAAYSYSRRASARELQRDAYPFRTQTGRACFLSAFDEQEPAPLYFLAQLPRGAKPATYAEAVECLKPAEVRDAEQAGAHMLRQGDVFAIETAHTTREVKRLPHHTMMGRRGTYVLGVNHTATESVELYPGPADRTAPATYARGILRHVPREWGRRAEHRRVKLGDGKTWYRLVRNTVPDGRSWSMAGNVD